MALVGFTTFDDSIIKLAVQSMWNTETIYQHIVDTIIETDNTYFPTATLPALHATIHHFIESIRVERLDTKISGGVLAPRYNIFSDNPPSTDPATWAAVRLYLAELKYPSAMDGTGTKERLIPCLICHSHTHPTGLCPFPNIPGWNGPAI